MGKLLHFHPRVGIEVCGAGVYGPPLRPAGADMRPGAEISEQGGAAVSLAIPAKLPFIAPMLAANAFQVAEMPIEEALRAIRKGLPAKAFDGVAKVLFLTGDELAAKLGVSVRTIRDQKKKAARLSPENSEKLVRIVRIQRLARTIFTTDEAVSQWLASPAPALNGLKPIDLLDTDLGGREVEAILQGIAYGNVM